MRGDKLGRLPVSFLAIHTSYEKRAWRRELMRATTSRDHAASTLQLQLGKTVNCGNKQFSRLVTLLQPVSVTDP